MFIATLLDMIFIQIWDYVQHWVWSWVGFWTHNLLIFGQTPKNSCLGEQQEDSCLPKLLIDRVRWIVSITQAIRMTDAQAFFKAEIYTAEFGSGWDSNSQPSDL